MKAIPAHEILDRIFRVILSEAEHNPTLARKVLRVLPKGIVAKLERTRAPVRKRSNAPRLHAINVLRLHGEPVLRGKLEQIRALEDLKAIARFSGLVLVGKAAKAKPTRADLIEGIIGAARHYDAQRAAAIALEPAVSSTRTANSA